MSALSGARVNGKSSRSKRDLVIGGDRMTNSRSGKKTKEYTDKRITPVLLW